jgi:hypothetical protein
MKSRFAYCDQPLPYPPGESPFHIKGEFYRQQSESIAHHQSRSGGALGRILVREGLADFAGQQFLSSAMYDVLPLPRIVMAVAEARGRDVHELASTMGRAAVEGQLRGVYSRFLTRLTTENFCQRFDQVIHHFYNFGPVTVTPQAGGAHLVRRGVPLCIAEWWSLVTVPFVVIPLTQTGARDVAAEWRIEPGGRDRDVPVGDVVWDVRWAAAGPPA